MNGLESLFGGSRIGNSFYGPLGSKYNACVPDDCPNFGPEKSQVFLSTVLVEMPVCFLPPGMSFDASEMAQDAWSEKLLSRWTEALKNGTWNTAPKGTLMTGALECELIIMTLYIGSRLLKSVDPRHGGRDAMCLLLRKSHDLLCGAAHLLGIQRQVMSGPLASGRFKPAAVKAKFTIPSLLALVLNRDFLVRLMIDMAEAYSLDESSLQEALQTAHMCQSFGSKVWDAEARYIIPK